MYTTVKSAVQGLYAFRWSGKAFYRLCQLHTNCLDRHARTAHFCSSRQRLTLAADLLDMTAIHTRLCVGFQTCHALLWVKLAQLWSMHCHAMLSWGTTCRSSRLNAVIDDIMSGAPEELEQQHVGGF